MENNYQQVRISVSEQEIREILVAQLSEEGYEGFVEERNILLAYIPLEAFNPALLADLLAPFQLSFELETIAQRNWNAEWEAGFQPVEVGSFCRIRADFHPANSQVDYDLVITPKMSFGTGHHATTYQMVAAMQKLDFTNKTVLDFGTGTGILAILAEKLGAKSVLAIDNDSWSIENTEENCQRNLSQRVSIQLLDSLEPLGRYDIILANINKNVILREIQALANHTNPGGAVVISGLLQTDAPDLQAAIESMPFSLENQTNKDGWLCWTLKRN